MNETSAKEQNKAIPCATCIHTEKDMFRCSFLKHDLENGFARLHHSKHCNGYKKRESE